METIQTYFFDASAIVKLYVDECGKKDAREIFAKASVCKTTSLCFVESLSAIKTNLLKKTTEDKYLDSVLDFVKTVKNMNIEIEEQNLFDSNIYNLAEIIIKKYRLDLSDALQIITIQKYILKKNCVLVTADKGLRKAAEMEGIKVHFIESKEENHKN